MPDARRPLEKNARTRIRSALRERPDGRKPKGKRR
jgi:hypothetical protein